MIYGSVVEQWSASCGVVLSFTSAIYSNIWHITTITAKVNEKSSSQLVPKSALSLVVIYTVLAFPRRLEALYLQGEVHCKRE